MGHPTEKMKKGIKAAAGPARRTGGCPTACLSMHEGERTMSTHNRKYVWCGLWGGLLVIGSMLGGGCTAGSPPVALEQARTAYAQAEQTPAVVANAPVPLQEANQALRRAERVWADDHDVAEVQHLATLATQRVEIARAAAEKKVAEAQIQQATEERDQVLLNARTREAQSAQQKAVQATQQAQAATTQVQQLQQELAALQAKQTDRGLVLTLGDVLFETGKATLRPGALRNLYPLVTFLQKYPERRVVIEGHTDSVGSDAYNLDLSQRRAESVRDFLLQNGVNAAQMSTHGYGKASPVASNDTAEGRQQNRRVELIIS
jgi:outer membrane protein OmpA-like peptidoglycan-associated protein